MSCLHRALGLARGEPRPFSCLPEHAHSPGHVHSHTHEHSLLDTQKYLELFKVPYGHLGIWVSHSLDFPCKLFGYPICLSSLIHQWRHPSTLSNYLWLFLTSAPGERLSALGDLWVKSNNDTVLWVESSREPPDRSNNNISLGMGLLRSSNPVLLPLVACRLPVFNMIAGCSFSGY